MSDLKMSGKGRYVKRGSYSRHGMTGSPEHLAWSNMLQRCYNPNAREYCIYGGRGIVVCGRWRESFANFLADVGMRPSSQYSIDRINSDASYCPENVRWATRKEQQQNLRKNVNITHGGMTLCVREWARRLGIPKNTILQRYHKGLSSEKIFEVFVPRPPEMKGVYFNRRAGNWQASIRVGQKQVSLGSFVDPEHAKAAVAKARRELPDAEDAA